MPPPSAIRHLVATLERDPNSQKPVRVLRSRDNAKKTTKEPAMKILVVDDHPLVLEALRAVLHQLDAVVDVYDATSSDRARQLVNAHPDADLLLLDLGLPDTDGFTLLGEIRAEHPTIPVVVLSGSEDHADVTRALDSGAMGYIPKSCPNDVLIGALRLVMSGGLYVPPTMLHRPSGAPSRAEAVRPQGGARPEALGLTPRQSEVLALVLQGLPNKVICRRLGLAEPTVKVHMQAVLRALQADNRVQAVIEASRRGLTIDALMAFADSKRSAADATPSGPRAA
jgi:DNA-binding NarL/FixJ family response regulator